MRNKTILIFLLFMSILSADSPVTIKMQGDLDDDLFILKSSSKKVDFLDCLQMHNPTKRFFYDGKMVKSEKIYGMVDFNKTYNLAEDEILLVMMANEREEINPKRSLFKRTHFKNVDLFLNDTLFIPSLMPESNDIPNYPLWFGKDDKPCMAHTSNYNYYKIWENAIVNLGLVFGTTGRYNLHFINKNNQIIFKKEVEVELGSKNIYLLGSHPLTEVDGMVFAGVSKDDMIREKAIDAILIQKEGNSQYIKLPYLFPYINRLFVKGL